jgi:hypothetical protein
MHRRLAVLAVLSALPCLAGCTSGSKPVATPRPTAFPYPSSAGQLSPFPTPDTAVGELAHVDNLTDAAKATGSFTVSVASGLVFGTFTTCQGQGSLVVTTVPDSQGSQTINCDGNDTPSGLGAFAENAETATTTYRVNVRATGAARWHVAGAALPASEVSPVPLPP